MRLLTLRIPDQQRAQWINEARRLKVTVTDLVKAAVDERIAAAAGNPELLIIQGIDRAQISVTHGSDLVVVTTVHGGDASVWAGTPAAARALASALLYQAASAETPKPCQAVP